MPAYSSTEITRIPAISSGLSLVPVPWIALSTTAPGVSRMTSSATAVTGESRRFIADDVR